jgi:phage gpG-like protein
MITAHLVGEQRVLARLRDMPVAIKSGLVRAITKLGTDLQRKVQQDELTGQMLAARSGLLKSSIDLRVDQGATVVTATVFTDSAYAGAHEYGFAGTVNVRASLRHITEAFGRPISGKLISVRAHSRRMDLPERSFLRSALEDMAPAIRDEVEASLRETVTE